MFGALSISRDISIMGSDGLGCVLFFPNTRCLSCSFYLWSMIYFELQLPTILCACNEPYLFRFMSLTQLNSQASGHWNMTADYRAGWIFIFNVPPASLSFPPSSLPGEYPSITTWTTRGPITRIITICISCGSGGRRMPQYWAAGATCWGYRRRCYRVNGTLSWDLCRPGLDCGPPTAEPIYNATASRITIVNWPKQTSNASRLS